MPFGVTPRIAKASPESRTTRVLANQTGLASSTAGVPPSDDQTDRLRAYDASIAVYNPVFAKASNAAAIPLRWYRQTGPHTDEREELPADHELVRAFGAGLPEDYTPWRFRFRLVLWIELAGECPIELLSADDEVVTEGQVVGPGVPPSFGPPVFVKPLRPDRVRPVMRRAAPYGVGGYRYDATSRTSDPVWYSREQVHVIGYPHPEQDYHGHSPLGPATDPLKANLYGWRYNWRYFENGATPSVFITTDDALTENQIAAMENRWLRKLQGVAKSNLPFFGSSGTKPVPMAETRRDMQFNDNLELSEIAVATAHNVPPVMLGKGDLTHENARTQVWQFSHQSLLPVLRLIETDLTWRVGKRHGDDIFAEHDRDELPSIEATELEQREQDLRELTAGAITINDWRALRGMEQRDDGDVYLAPSNVEYVRATDSTVDDLIRSVEDAGQSTNGTNGTGQNGAAQNVRV